MQANMRDPRYRKSPDQADESTKKDVLRITDIPIAQAFFNGILEDLLIRGVLSKSGTSRGAQEPEIQEQFTAYGGGLSGSDKGVGRVWVGWVMMRPHLLDPGAICPPSPPPKVPFKAPRAPDL